MSEIVVGDVLAWEPRLSWHGEDAELVRPLSWAVAIHARIPALPPMRGDELILVNQQTIDHLRRVEKVVWTDITRLLAAQPMAGLIVEETFTEAPVPGVPLFRADASFFLDGETHLNRTITERRGELYRLGSDLSRALSTASIAGADLDALFAVAGDVGHSDLLLFDRSGRVLGRSRTGPATVPFSLAQIKTANEIPLSVDADDGRWLIDAITVPGSERMFLACSSSVSGAPETGRLVLSQTARAIETFIGKAGNWRPVSQASSRDSMLLTLLLGQVPAERLEPHSRLLGFEPATPLRVLLLLSRQAADLQRVQRRLPQAIRKQAVSLPTGELAVLDVDDTLWADMCDLVLGDESLGVIRSEPQTSVHDISRAVHQARTLGRLWSAGVLKRQIIDAADLGPDSYVGLVLSASDPAAFEPHPARLDDYVTRLLGALTAHDNERNSDLVRTLEGYLAAGGSTTGAAELLGVHRNTLAYRLARISELTGSDLGDASTRLALGLGLKIRALQQALTGA